MLTTTKNSWNRVSKKRLGSTKLVVKLAERPKSAILKFENRTHLFFSRGRVSSLKGSRNYQSGNKVKACENYSKLLLKKPKYCVHTIKEYQLNELNNNT